MLRSLDAMEKIVVGVHSVVGVTAAALSLGDLEVEVEPLKLWTYLDRDWCWCIACWIY